MLKRFPIHFQYDSKACGAACLSMIADYFGRKLGQEKIASLCDITRNGCSMSAIKIAAEEVGLCATGIGISLDSLIKKSSLPCILHWNNTHFVVLYKISHSFFDKKNIIFHVADPAFGYVKFNSNEIKEHWETKEKNDNQIGYLITLKPTPSFFEQPNFQSKQRGLKLFLHFFEKYKSTFIKLGIGVLFGSILQLIFPFLTQSIIDIGIGNQDISFIYIVLLAQFMLIISRTVIEFIRRWLILHMSVHINISLITTFIGKLIRLPMFFFEARKTGDILQRISDFNKIENFITSQALLLIFSFFTMIIFSIILIYYNLNIFLVFCIGSLLYAIWTATSLKKRKILNYKFFNKLSQNQSTTWQLVTGMQELKLQGSANRKRKEWENLQIELLELQREQLKIEQQTELGNIFINESKNILITVMAATSVISGDITLGMMLAIQYIIGQLISPVDQTVRFILSLQEVRISIDRVNEIFDREDEVRKDQISSRSSQDGSNIRIDNLSFKYNKSNHIFTLKDISFVIPKNKITAIVGSSGSGKTTLIKLLLKFYNLNQGAIIIDENINLSDINPEWWRKQCGVVMQNGYLFSDTIERNIATDDGEIDYTRLKYASIVSNIYDTVMSLPLKYETLIGAEGQGLSQGQRQRLLIARAVYKDPQFIFFDEATNSLDAKNEKMIVDNLSSFFKGKTCVIVAHRLSTVKNADQIIVLENGKIVEQGNHEALTSLRGKYFHLVKNQLELGN